MKKEQCIDPVSEVIRAIRRAMLRPFGSRSDLRITDRYLQAIGCLFIAL
jgi:hypothetical protein